VGGLLGQGLLDTSMPTTDQLVGAVTDAAAGLGDCRF
jgi:hypothetical protein